MVPFDAPWSRGPLRSVEADDQRRPFESERHEEIAALCSAAHSDNMRVIDIFGGARTRRAPAKHLDEVGCLDSFAQGIGGIGADVAVRVWVESCRDSTFWRDNRKAKSIAR